MWGTLPSWVRMDVRQLRPVHGSWSPTSPFSLNWRPAITNPACTRRDCLARMGACKHLPVQLRMALSLGRGEQKPKKQGAALSLSNIPLSIVQQHC
jgi:hypothetical protein